MNIMSGIKLTPFQGFDICMILSRRTLPYAIALSPSGFIEMSLNP